MKPQLIKSKLVEKGIRQVDIARDLAVSKAAVNRTIAGVMRSDKIQTEISRRLSLPKGKIFPARRSAA